MAIRRQNHLHQVRSSRHTIRNLRAVKQGNRTLIDSRDIDGHHAVRLFP